METVQLGGSKNFYKYSEMNPEEMILENAEYLGSQEGTYGVQHEFRKDDGTIHVLNSAGQLNYILDNFANVGDMLNVQYLGKVLVPKGPMKGKEAHNFNVTKIVDKSKPKTNSDIDLDDLE